MWDEFIKQKAIEEIQGWAILQNANREGRYREAHAQWLADAEWRRAHGLDIPPVPTPESLVRCAVLKTGEPTLVYGPEPVIDPLPGLPELRPPEPGIARVGPQLRGSDHYAALAGDTMPDGAVVESGGTRFRKRLVGLFGGIASAWYEVVP